MLHPTPKTKAPRRASAATHHARHHVAAAFDRTAVGDVDVDNLSPSLEFDLDSDEYSRLKAIFEASSDTSDPMFDDPDGGMRRR